MDPFLPEYASKITYVTLDIDVQSCVKLSHLDPRIYWSARINRLFLDCVERKAGAIIAAFPPMSKKPPVAFAAFREINHLSDSQGKPDLTELVTLVVHPDHRRRGIAAALLNEAAARARFHLHGFFPLETTAVNKTTAFFESPYVKPHIDKSRLCLYRPKQTDVIHLRQTTENAPYVVAGREWIEFWMKRFPK